MDHKRLFIAVPVRELPDYPMVSAEGIRWIPLENFHLTLCFLGKVAEESIPELLSGLEDLSSQYTTFTVRAQKYQFWPNLEDTKMLWLRFADHEQWHNLVQSIQTVCKAFMQENSFHKQQIPHVTLARFKTPDVAKKIPIEHFPIPNVSLSVDKIALYESALNSNGSTYRILRTFPLSS